MADLELGLIAVLSTVALSFFHQSETPVSNPQPISTQNNIPTINSLTPDLPSPHEAGSIVTWTADASDPDGDQIYYQFWLTGPSTLNLRIPQTRWSTSNIWTWATSMADLGSNTIEVEIRDGRRADPVKYDSDSYDGVKTANFVITPADASLVATGPLEIKTMNFKPGGSYKTKGGYFVGYIQGGQPKARPISGRNPVTEISKSMAKPLRSSWTVNWSKP